MANTLRAKCLKLRGALETLAGCLPDRIFVYGECGEKWTDFEDLAGEDAEVIDFKEILGE